MSRYEVPGVGVSLQVPSEWSETTWEGTAFAAREPDAPGFATNVNVVVVPGAQTSGPRSLLANLATLTNAVLIDHAATEGPLAGIDATYCHRVGVVSVMARQREVQVGPDLVVVTVSAATRRWGHEVAAVTGIIDSLVEEGGDAGDR